MDMANSAGTARTSGVACSVFEFGSVRDIPGNPIVAIIVSDGTGKQTKHVGRSAWALAQLLDRGATGITPIERPAPRWSDYVFKLRKAGLVVETIDENHGGAFAGQHARYVLRTPLSVVSVEREADRRAKQ
jgi:hypothetical protein